MSPSTTRDRGEPAEGPVGRSAALARGGVLLLGAAAVLVLVEGGALAFFWVPLMLGLTYLVAAAVGRSTGSLWAPGWVLATVGLTEGLWFDAGRPADSFELAQLTLLSAGTGALFAAAMRAVGVRVSAMSIALAVLLTGAFNLAEAKAVAHVAGNTRLYAGLLAAFAVWELVKAQRRRP